MGLTDLKPTPTDTPVADDLSGDSENTNTDGSVYVIRHSERCDHVKDKVERKKIEYRFEPPITARGHEFAYKTGLFLKEEMNRLVKEKLKKENFKFVVITSPYYRCLQTSMQICKGSFFL